MRRNYLILVVAIFAACVKGSVTVEDTDSLDEEIDSVDSVNLRRSLRSNIRSSTDTEDEERLKTWVKNLVAGSGQQKSDVAKIVKETPALAKTLDKNPSLVSAIEKNPQLGNSFKKIQNDEGLLKSIESLGTNNKLKTALSKKPNGLSEQNVKQLGAAVVKSAGKRGEHDEGVLFACGLILSIILGGELALVIAS